MVLRGGGPGHSKPSKPKPIHFPKPNFPKPRPIHIPKIPIEKATKPINKGLNKGFNYVKNKITHPVATIDEAKRALNKLDEQTHGSLGIVYQGAQIIFPEFGMAVTLAQVANEMLHNDGRLSKKTLKNILLNQATDGLYGNYQGARTIEKNELIKNIEHKFDVDLHDLPDDPIKVDGNVSINDTTKNFK